LTHDTEFLAKRKRRKREFNSGTLNHPFFRRLKGQSFFFTLFISFDLLARKNNRFKGAIRTFVTPKNDGIDIILPEVNKEMKDEFFLNLLSHLY